MATKIEILKNSLEKKKKVLDNKFETHFATVKQANGQPLNDKRNGQATLNKWDKQSGSIRTQQTSIKKTETAIEREEGKIIETRYAYDSMPTDMRTLIDDGSLTQWRKHPHILFVDGVEKARIIWDAKKKIVSHNYTNKITDKKQWRKFAKLFNFLTSIIK